jgi:outer membrane protein assembly factor BamB
MRTLLALGICLCAPVAPAGAADWPQWRGPTRTDVSEETGLLKTWPKEGPRLLWTDSNAGVGYSGPAVVGDRLYTMGARDGTEYLLALDTNTGKELWACQIAPIFKEGHGSGPRGTPAVDGALLYGIGGQGELVCVETATGKLRWHVNLRKDLGGEMMSGWGYTESPLIDGDRVVCTPGGAQGTLASLDKRTGKVIWRSKELKDKATYSSAIVAEVGGVRQFIQMTYASSREQLGGIAGVAANDGRLLWYLPRQGYRTAVIPTPIFDNNHVYVTAGYGAGCDLITLSPDSKGGTKAEKVYTNKNMVNHHGGVVLVGEHLYGYSDNERGWICQEFKSGKIVWSEKKKLGKGSVTYADGNLYCYAESDGTLALIEASPEGWKESGRFKIPQESKARTPSGRTWTHPVVANGRLYLRDQDLFFCFDVKDRAISAR